MRTTRQYSITMPLQMAEFIDAKIASGDYATESEVFREGLRALKAKDEAFEVFLRESAENYRQYLADPSIARPLSEYNRERDKRAHHARLQARMEKEQASKDADRSREATFRSERRLTDEAHMAPARPRRGSKP